MLSKWFRYEMRHGQNARKIDPVSSCLMRLFFIASPQLSKSILDFEPFFQILYSSNIYIFYIEAHMVRSVNFRYVKHIQS